MSKDKSPSISKIDNVQVEGKYHVEVEGRTGMTNPQTFFCRGRAEMDTWNDDKRDIQFWSELDNYGTLCYGYKLGGGIESNRPFVQKCSMWTDRIE